MFSRFREWWRARAPFSPARRNFLASLGVGVGVGAGLRKLRAQQDPEPAYLRPPGALAEAQFTNRCIRCNACFHACPTGTLKPSTLAQGLLGYGTPVLATREGGCEHGCNACGQACPTGAIRDLPLPEKQQLKMGTAHIDPARCIPYATGAPCTSCVKACPYDAIHWEYPGAELPWGGLLGVPVVDPEKCTGCGLCETSCPVAGVAAIVVAPEYPRRPLAVAAPSSRRIDTVEIGK